MGQEHVTISMVLLNDLFALGNLQRQKKKEKGLIDTFLLHFVSTEVSMAEEDLEVCAEIFLACKDI